MTATTVTPADGGRLPTPELRGGRVLLRPLRDSDASARRGCGYDAEFERMLGHVTPASPEMTEEAADGWLRARVRMPLCWAMEVGGRCVGTVGFVSTSQRSAWAALSVEIFDTALWGRGLGSEAIRLALRHAFETLGLHRVSATTDCDNAASVALLERVGMRREAHFRQHVWFKGRWSSEYVYALLRREWPAPS